MKLRLLDPGPYFITDLDPGGHFFTDRIRIRIRSGIVHICIQCTGHPLYLPTSGCPVVSSADRVSDVTGCYGLPVHLAASADDLHQHVGLGPVLGGDGAAGGRDGAAWRRDGAAWRRDKAAGTIIQVLLIFLHFFNINFALMFEK